VLNKYIAKNSEKTAYRVIDDEAVIVDLEDSTFHALNPVATFIWEQMDGKTRVEEIIQRVCREFEVTRETAEKDCREFINALNHQGMVMLSSDPLEKT